MGANLTLHKGGHMILTSGIVSLLAIAACAAALVISWRAGGRVRLAALVASLAAFIMVMSAVIVFSVRPTFSGEWDSSWGRLSLAQRGDRVSGTYAGSVPGRVEGTVSGTRLDYRWSDSKRRSGRGYWIYTVDGQTVRLVGRWGSGDSDSDGGEWIASAAGGGRDGERGSRKRDYGNEKRGDGGGRYSGGEGKTPLSKPVMPFGTAKCVSCPAPNRNGVLPQDRWLVIITSSEGPNQAMFLNSRTGVLHDAEYPDVFVKNGHYPCFQRCYTFESQNVLKVFDPNTGKASRYPIKILNFGMNTYVFGPMDGQDRSWDALQYPGWGPNGETDLSSRCDCR